MNKMHSYLTNTTLKKTNKIVLAIIIAIFSLIYRPSSDCDGCATQYQYGLLPSFPGLEVVYVACFLFILFFIGMFCLFITQKENQYETAVHLEVMEHIGRGGFADTFQARLKQERQTESQVVLKMVKDEQWQIRVYYFTSKLGLFSLKIALQRASDT